jgi:hypothetical protein
MMYDFNEAGYLAYSMCDCIAKIKNYRANVWDKKWGEYRIYIAYNNRRCGYICIDYWSNVVRYHLSLRIDPILKTIGFLTS